MMGGGKPPKKLGGVVNKLLEKKTPTIQNKGMAMQPFRPKKDTIDDQGNPISKGMKNHVGMYDDTTYEATSFLTRLPQGPLGQQNDVATPNLMKPNKSLHPQGKGQYVANTEFRYRVSPKHIEKVTNPDTVNYFDKEQDVLQKIHNSNVQKHANKRTEIKYTTNAQEMAQLRVQLNQELMDKINEIPESKNNTAKDDEIF